MSVETEHPETTSPTAPAVHTQAAIAALPYADPNVHTASRPRAGRGQGNKFFVHAALLVVCAIAIVPFLWMVSTSLKSLEDVMSGRTSFVPQQFAWRNYVDVFTDPRSNFLLWTRNTLIIAVLGVAGTTFSSALVAYGFAKMRFRGNKPLFVLMLSTMMLPFPVVMVPLFILFKWLGLLTGEPWLGTFKPLWLPAWFGSAFNIFLLRQFFLTIPNELSEAARIDGCSDFGIFWRIILPLARPALSVVALFAFMGIWNDYLGPLIYLQRPEQFTLALGLQNFQSKSGGTSWHLLMAASTLVILPVIVLFFLAQRTFIEGIATTGTKG